MEFKYSLFLRAVVLNCDFASQLVMCKDISGCHSWEVPQYLMGKSPGMLLSVLQHTGHPFATKIDPAPNVHRAKVKNLCPRDALFS